MSKTQADTTTLINAWAARRGDDADLLFKRVLPQLRLSAHRNLRGDGRRFLQTTELVDEMFTRLANQHVPEFRDRNHFFAVVEILTKWCVLDELRRAGAQRRDYILEVALDDAPELSGSAFCDQAAELNVAMDELRQRNPVNADIFERKAVRGETCAEIASAVGLSITNVWRRFELARAWLAVRLTSGRRAADELAGGPDER